MKKIFTNYFDESELETMNSILADTDFFWKTF